MANNLNHSMLFIGGTGRSGTTVLKKILSKHQSIETVGSELRVFVDPNGIVDLYNSLVKIWDPFRASSAIEQFIYFWKNSFTTSYFPKYLRGVTRNSFISPLKYRQVKVSKLQKRMLNDAIDKFINFIGVDRVNATWYGTKSLSIKPQFYSCPKITKRQFVEAINFLIDDLVEIFKSNRQPHYLIDDTPYSILRYMELNEFLPNAKYINIARHPLDVLCSYEEQRWCHNLGDASNRLNDVYSELIALETESQEWNYKTIKLESLISQPDKILEDVCSFLNIENTFDITMLGLTDKSLGRYRARLSKAEVSHYKRQFKDVFDWYQYD